MGRDLETGDHSVLQVTGKRGWLRLNGRENGEAEEVKAELVFIGKPGATSAEALREHFENARKEAAKGGTHLVKDLRAFEVIFA